MKLCPVAGLWDLRPSRLWLAAGHLPTSKAIRKANMKVSGEQIVRATEMLRAKYPQERVVLWCDIPPHGEARYTAGVGEAPGAEYWTHDDPVMAVMELIRRAGERNPDALRQQRIAKLREELEELEAQGMAQLIQECDEQKAEVV